MSNDEAGQTPAEGTQKFPKATIGRIVEFTFGSHFDTEMRWSGPNGQSQVVPAMIVQVWSDTCVNLCVFIDGSERTVAKTSICRHSGVDPEEGQIVADSWQWPERS